MPQLFYADNTPIPDADVPAAIADGKAFARDSRVKVADAQGNVGTIDASELGNPNYRPLSDGEIEAARIKAERGTVGQQALTAGEGALRGATLGLSDAALVGALGDDYRKAADERRTENSKTALVGELGGAIAPALLSGGASAEAQAAIKGVQAAEEGSALLRGAGAVARGISAPVRAVSGLGGMVERGAGAALEGLGLTGESALARTALKGVKLGAAGATEGALFGAGSVLSDSQLKGDPLTTEALVAGMGHGMLFGGLLGAGIGAASEAIPSALGKLASKESAEEFAIGRARKQLGRDFENVGKGQTREVAEKWKNESAELLLKRKLVGGDNAGKTVLEASTKPQDIADNLGQLRRDIGREIGEVHDKAAALIDQAPHLAPNPEELIQRLEAKAAEFRKQHNSGAYAQARALQTEVKALRNAIAEGQAGASAGGRIGEALDVNVGAFDRTSMRPESFDYLRGAGAEPNRLGPPRIEIYPDGAHLGDGRHRMALAYEAGEKSMPANVVRYDGDGNVLSEAMENVSLSSSPANSMREAVTVRPGAEVPGGAAANDVTPAFGYQSIREWQQNLNTQINPQGVPNAMRATAVKNLAAREAANEIAKDYIKETASKVLAAAGEDAAQLTRLNQEFAGTLSMQKAAEKEAKRVASNRTVSLTDHMLGIGGALLASASGNLGALGTMGFGAAASLANKFAREQGNAVLANIAMSISRKDALIDAAAKALSNPGSKMAAPVKAIERATYNPTSPAALRTDFAQVRDRLQELQVPEHQAAQLTHATERIHSAYPELAGALSQSLLKTHQYLAAQLPKPQGGSMLSPLAQPPSVPPREMQKFLTKVNAAMDPESVIRDVARGKLDREAVGVLRDLYPETFGQLRSKTMEYVTTNHDVMPYTRVVHVSEVFGFSGDSSMGPRFQGLQESIKQSDQASQQQQPPAMPRLKGPPIQPGEAMQLPGARAPGA